MSSSVYILLYSITTQTQDFLCLDNFILILFFWSSNTITISFKTCSKHITDHLLCNNQFFTDHSYKMLRTYSQKILVCVVHLWSWVKTNKNNNFCEKLIINLCKFWTTLLHTNEWIELSTHEWRHQSSPWSYFKCKVFFHITAVLLKLNSAVLLKLLPESHAELNLARHSAC